ncbi:MAG: 16S rRNA (cytidine(1402)-2'-O)-methyltransferase [bacterium]
MQADFGKARARRTARDPGNAARDAARSAAPDAAGETAGALYIVSTPIGNLEDVTLRALRILKEADVVACEDTRVTRTLLTHYGIGTRTTPYHERNRERAAPGILARLARGESVAVVTDAGTPGISDPAAHLVALAIEGGFVVSPIPGASAPAAALAASGLQAARYVFEGFLPKSGSARRQRIARLAAEPHTIVIFESPTRVAATLKDLAAALGQRRAVVAREITKMFEEFARATLPELAARYAEKAPRGEVVLVIEGIEGAARGGARDGKRQSHDASAVNAASSFDRAGVADAAGAALTDAAAPHVLLEAALRRVAELAAEGARPSAAVARAAREFGVPRRELYTRYADRE